MTTQITSFQGIFFIALFTLVYIIILRNIRPLRKHKRRPFSTILLKSSYMLYLASYFLYIFMFLFSGKSRLLNEHISEARLRYYMIIFVVLTVIPHLAIVLRRKFHENRVPYNMIFSILNLVLFGFIIFILLSKKFGILI